MDKTIGRISLERQKPDLQINVSRLAHGRTAENKHMNSDSKDPMGTRTRIAFAGQTKHTWIREHCLPTKLGRERSSRTGRHSVIFFDIFSNCSKLSS